MNLFPYPSRVTPPWFSMNDPTDNSLHAASTGRIAQPDAVTRGQLSQIGMCQGRRPQSHKVRLDMTRVQRLPARGGAYTDLPHPQARGGAHWKLVSEKEGRPASLESKHYDPRVELVSHP